MNRNLLPAIAATLAIAASTSACGENLTLPPDRADYTAAAAQPLDCLPNLDGQLDADELPTVFDTPVQYRVSPANEAVRVDITGARDQAGIRVWDWSTDAPTDERLLIEVNTPEDFWFSGSFPQAEFVAPLDASATTLGVYSRSAAGVFLHGYASTEQSPASGQTLVRYTDPVAVYRFPLRVGDSWTSIGEVRNATVLGLPYAGRDVYSFEVDESGELWLPDLRFEDVMRVRLHLTVEPSVGVGSTRRQVGYVFECFGEVARATSAPDEQDEDFDTALEVRRLGY